MGHIRIACLCLIQWDHRARSLHFFKWWEYVTLANRHSSFNEGDEIALDQFKDLAIYCYLECLQLELDILDIKNQHITACANIGTQSDYYLYGPPESINDEYIERCKKQLPGWKIAGSFKETL